METEKLHHLARKYVWWKSPGEAIGDKNHFIAQVMTYGVMEDCFWLLKHLGEADFITALRNPPIGVFNGRSWHFRRKNSGLS